MSERIGDSAGLPFPIELMIEATPRSHQAKNGPRNEAWKATVRKIAEAHVNALTEFFVLDPRPLAVSIYYFPPVRMQGDVDNIVKFILDGMVHVLYPNDQVIERVTVQKIEPGTEVVFRNLTHTLERAIDTDPPVVYIRIDDDLSWREVT